MKKKIFLKQLEIILVYFNIYLYIIQITSCICIIYWTWPEQTWTLVAFY